MTRRFYNWRTERREECKHLSQFDLLLDGFITWYLILYFINNNWKGCIQRCSPTYFVGTVVSLKCNLVELVKNQLRYYLQESFKRERHFEIQVNNFNIRSTVISIIVSLYDILYFDSWFCENSRADFVLNLFTKSASPWKYYWNGSRYVTKALSRALTRSNSKVKL